MELRVLRYFLAVAREESISGAAAALHVTQPTLSRQMMELEEVNYFGFCIIFRHCIDCCLNSLGASCYLGRAFTRGTGGD